MGLADAIMRFSISEDKVSKHPRKLSVLMMNASKVKSKKMIGKSLNLLACSFKLSS